MKRVIRLTLLPLLFALGCGAPEQTGPASAQETAAGGPSGTLFSADLEERDCEVLTAAMVSQVSGVPEAELKSSTPGGWCRYEGGDVTATIMFIKVGDDASNQAQRFNNAYKNRTGEEVAAGMEQVKAEADKQAAGGTLDPATAAGAKAVGDAVAGGPLAGGFQYEEIDGPWDKAMFDTGEQEMNVGGMEIKSFTNTLHVLVSNMDFSVEYQTQEAASHKDKVVELARAIVEHLPK